MGSTTEKDRGSCQNKCRHFTEIIKVYVRCTQFTGVNYEMATAFSARKTVLQGRAKRDKITISESADTRIGWLIYAAGE
ncbi:MAG: hypothetical protein Kow0063_26930 [Anaerolineae bacterium]